VDTTDSLIHCAASLNRKSEKQCLNVNLRGTLEVIQLARRAQNRNGLRRYSHVSTVAVAGKRENEVVTEDASIDWSRSDYDPYARTKKFCEHMANQLLPDVPKTIFRPLSFSATAAARRLRNSTWFKRSMFWRRCLFFPCALTIKSTSYRRTTSARPS